MKPKELDWAERLENVLGNREDLIKQLVDKVPEDKIIEGLKYFDETKRQLDELIQSLLTQQRTELLESVSQLVKNLIKGRQLWLEDGSLAPDFGVIPELRQYNQAIVDVLSILNLLNKKDETN